MPAALRGFGPLGLAAILAILAGNLFFPPLSALLVLVWAYASETPWHELGFVRPRSWTRSIAIGVGFGAANKLILKAIVMPLLGAPQVNARYHFVTGNAAVLPGLIATMIIVAGFGEETLYRGYMFERLGKLLGQSPSRQDRHRAHHDGAIRRGALPGSGNPRSRASRVHGARVRRDLCCDRRAVHADGRARHVSTWWRSR